MLFRNPERQAAREQYKAALTGLTVYDGDVQTLKGAAQQVMELEEAAGYKPKERAALRRQALVTLADHVLADEVLTEDEEDVFFATAGLFGLEPEDVGAFIPALMSRMMVAAVNAGRLPVEPEPELLAKADETVHWEVPANLLKEVTVREFQGGYSGVSIRVAKGVRYNTGGTRGRSVAVGTRVEAADAGILSLTSRRAVFMGSRKTIEFAYSKLVRLQASDDTVTFSVSNRQSAPTFAVPDGHAVGAIATAAAGRMAPG